MPTESDYKLMIFTNSLSQLSAVVQSSNVEAMYMIWDYNSNPGKAFATELLDMCSKQRFG